MCPLVDTFDDDDSDARMEAEMDSLRSERDSILNHSHPALKVELAQLAAVRDTRLRVACDARKLRLADARARAKAENRNANAQCTAAKAALRTHMLRRAAISRTTFVKSDAGVARKRQRSFVHALERQGVLRLALAPDAVNADLAAAKLAADRAVDADFIVSGGERVHTARGILHIHDEVVEKGHIVAVWQSKSGTLPKWHGEVVGINRKEISIRTSDNQTHKVFVKELKQARFVIKRDYDGNGLRNKKL